MSAGPIVNAANIPLNQINGTVPDVSGALQNYFQPMVFTAVRKVVVNFQVVESPTRINFQGVIQTFSSRELKMLPEGQRTQWQWWMLHAEPGLILVPDEVVYYLGKQYRVMSQSDYKLYGYVQYILQTDWSVSI